VADTFKFTPKNQFTGMRPATEGDSGMPHVLQAFAELKELVDAGKIEGLVIVGVTADDEPFGAVAGLINPITMTGLLEHVKAQILER
jgi:hypothetical protein